MRDIDAALAGVAIALTVLAPGCAADRETIEDNEDSAETAMGLSVGNGMNLNGTSLNGTSLNGTSLNGTSLNGMNLNGMNLNGMNLNGTSLDESLLSATLPNGKPISGAELVGATMTGTLTNGSTVLIRIDAVTPSSDPTIWFYWVSYSSSGDFLPLCTSATGTPAPAIALSGLWDYSRGSTTGGEHIDDPSRFTFACDGYAIAKCVMMGYKPWSEAEECLTTSVCHKVSLAAYHQACTRMLLADYCGDGMTTTRDGTIIDVADNLGIQIASQPTWIFEAEWGESGATCIQTTRWSTLSASVGGIGVKNDKGMRVKKYIDEHCPTRWAGRKSACGTPLSSYATLTGYTTPMNVRSLLSTRISTK